MRSDQSNSILWLLASISFLLLVLLAGLKVIAPAPISDGAEVATWTREEVALLRSLSLEHDSELPSFEGLTNEYEGSAAAASFGHQLFFDSDLSRTGATSCASCHQPDRAFTDGLAHPATHVQTAPRNTPTLIGAGSSPWQFWDGRSDSLWSQALEALESPLDHGLSRSDLVSVVSMKYRPEYEALFGELPVPDDSAEVDRAFTNVGKAIGAYVAMLRPAPAKFDRYVASLSSSETPGEPVELLTKTEIAGLKLFISEDKGQCISCHNGPLFTNNEFKSINVPDFSGADSGRLVGAKQVLRNPFNCLGNYSAAEKESCDELLYIKKDDPELYAAFKVPTLRNLSLTAPYMHSGIFLSLADVLKYYNHPMQRANDHLDIVPLGMFPHELQQLEAFLMTLDSGVDIAPEWLRPPESVKSHISNVNRRGDRQVAGTSRSH